jgi:hypothetical protein
MPAIEIQKSSQTKNIKQASLYNCLDQKIDLYKDISLLKMSSTQKISENLVKNDSEIGIGFNIDGELTGNALCLLDIGERATTPEQKNNLINIFKEAMNILIGKFLTNLEEQTGMMALISPPQIFDLEQDLPESFRLRKNFPYHFQTNYILMNQGAEYCCVIYFQTSPHQNNTSEV